MDRFLQVPGLLMLLVFTLLLAISSTVHADGLFDFQMKLAEKGNAEAQFKVGEMYETGFGVSQDMEEAKKWITKAADKGHETAGFKLIYWDVEKNGLNDANKADVETLKSKADAGNAQAQYYVGKMHARGIGLKKDPDKALDWLNKAALVGVLEAEREIAIVREDKQRQAAAQRRAEEKRRAELKAKQEQERQAKLEEQRRLQKQKEAEARSRAKAQEIERQEQASAQARAKEQAERERVLAQKEVEERQREAERQALIKKREQEEKEREAQFESDPCSGKSARFLSTCR